MRWKRARTTGVNFRGKCIYDCLVPFSGSSASVRVEYRSLVGTVGAVGFVGVEAQHHHLSRAFRVQKIVQLRSSVA